MLRSLLRASAAVAFALLLASPQTPSAAPPPGIAYDEIVRVVVNATPPPPGNFQADLAAVNSPQPGAATPAPRRRGLGSIVNIASTVMNGGNAGSVASSVAAQAMSDAVANALAASLSASMSSLADAARSFLQPHLMRYAYWNGWERVDDVSAQTATIRKCDLGQVVELDLAKKTYSIYTPGAEPQPTYAPRPSTRGSSGAPATPAPPGTAVADLSETTQSLGQLRLENQPTVGYEATTAFTISHSTGSCRDGGASIQSTEYYSPLARPTVNSCPIRRAPVPESASEAVTMPSAQGGCRPTFTFHRSGPTPPSTRLPLYSLVTFSGRGGATPAPGASPAAGVGFLTERGNLKTLGSTDAALFEIPQGFTKTP